ncbi:hypothetical protein ACFL27_22365 [candidate division CSSED10-310 bacterium]|uniref:Uncharacterized protein n=1 Tax=candidate division CSSED10-310 bacterium TaxID=2855610 RepID=A0ABV6Z3D1_UNCC1
MIVKYFAVQKSANLFFAVVLIETCGINHGFISIWEPCPALYKANFGLSNSIESGDQHGTVLFCGIYEYFRVTMKI